MRRIEPERPIVVLLEDIDSITEKHSEHDVLAMLDGELQINNVVFIATTNYPEQLEDRIVNRPSRFDVVKQIGMPSAEARRQYLTTMSKRLREDEEELERWVACSNEYSVAHLKEMIIAVEALDQPLEEVTARLDKMRDSKPSSNDDFESDFGFTGGHSTITANR
jgi:SpoVK/Ycf46/Vps4 family AAA+-type ATPase